MQRRTIRAATSPARVEVDVDIDDEVCLPLTTPTPRCLGAALLALHGAACKAPVHLSKGSINASAEVEQLSAVVMNNGLLHIAQSAESRLVACRGVASAAVTRLTGPGGR